MGVEDGGRVCVCVGGGYGGVVLPPSLPPSLPLSLSLSLSLSHGIHKKIQQTLKKYFPPQSLTSSLQRVCTSELSAYLVHKLQAGVMKGDDQIMGEPL